MSTVTFAPTYAIVIRPVTVTTTVATLGTPTPGRKSLEIQNTGTNPIAVGGAGITFAQGRQILPGASWDVDLGDTVTLYAIASGGSSTAIFTEIK